MTVDLDKEAYDILCRQRPEGTAADLLELVKDLEISEDTLDRIEEVIQSRR